MTTPFEPWDVWIARRIGEKFREWMTAKYGGVIVAPRGGFQVDDLDAAFRAGYAACEEEGD